MAYIAQKYINGLSKETLDESAALIMSWDTRNTSGSDTDNLSVVMPLISGQSFNLTVDWGDGAVETYTTSDDLGWFHTYSSEGIYTIKIFNNSGLVEDIGFSFNHSPGDRRDQKKILNISQFGNITMFQTASNNRIRQFSQCSNLDITATDIYERCISGSDRLYGYFRNTGITTLHNTSNWDLSHVTDLTNTFLQCASLNIDVSNWNVSNVDSFSGLFQQCGTFNPDVTNWNVSKGEQFTGTFNSLTQFNRDLSGWVLKSTGTITLASTFNGCTNFLGTGLDSWNVSNVTNMSSLFGNCDIMDHSKIEGWDTGSVTNFYGIFLSNTGIGAADLSGWDVSSATNLKEMFRLSNFSGSVSGWTLHATSDVSVRQMFADSNFNGTLDNWTNTGSIDDMFQFLQGCNTFNQPMNSWDVSNVQDMTGVFQDCHAFNQPLSNWVTTACTDMHLMFDDCYVFNQDISMWNTANVVEFNNMFYNADAFNQDISGWNTSSGQNFSAMFFNNGAFDQNLGTWNISSATNMTNFASGANFSTANWDAMLNGWHGSSPPSGIVITMNAQYSSLGESARTDLIFTNGWTINDGGLAA